MYVTGTKDDYENRLHQLPTGIIDLNQFIVESGSYNTAFTYEKIKWLREMDKRFWALIGSGYSQ